MPPFRVLFVCTGNICRSPTAERLLRHRLHETYGDHAAEVAVCSAGTGALVGEAIQPHAAALLERGGADAHGFSARDLTEALVAEADLVLAMTRRHRGTVARLLPAVLPRLFTLREFARLAPHGVHAAPADDLAAAFTSLVEAVRAQRGLHHCDDPDEDDVPDPYGRPASAYERPYRLISDAVDGVVGALRVT